MFVRGEVYSYHFDCIRICLIEGKCGSVVVRGFRKVESAVWLSEDDAWSRTMQSARWLQKSQDFAAKMPLSLIL